MTMLDLCALTCYGVLDEHPLDVGLDTADWRRNLNAASCAAVWAARR